MKPLYAPCSYCKNNKKKRSNCCSSLSAKRSSKSKKKIRSCGNSIEGLHRFSIERLIKRTSLFGVVASEDNQRKSSLINLCRTNLFLSLVNGIKDDNGIHDSGEEEGRKKCCRRKHTKV